MSEQSKSRGKRSKRKLTQQERVKVRSEMSERTQKYGLGGAVKTKNAPKTITLPKLKFLED